MPRPTARHPELHAELLAAEAERMLPSLDIEKGRAHIGIPPKKRGGAAPQFASARRRPPEFRIETTVGSSIGCRVL